MSAIPSRECRMASSGAFAMWQDLSAPTRAMQGFRGEGLAFCTAKPDDHFVDCEDGGVLRQAPRGAAGGRFDKTSLTGALSTFAISNIGIAQEAGSSCSEL
jgi:hypothetical protein